MSQRKRATATSSSTPGARARVAGWRIGDHELVVASYPTIGSSEPDSIRALEHLLTAAEREVMHALLSGHSRRRIAHDRGRALSTVAHQIESIHRKLGVSSLAELAALCAGGQRA